MATDTVDLAAQQDALRPLRTFVGVLGGALLGYDQSNAYSDVYAGNFPRQYQSVGPNGYSVEGTPIAATNNGGLYISPMVVLLGLGAAAALLWKH